MTDLYATRRLQYSHFWKGGRARNTQGYVLIHKRGHPHASKEGYVLEHRWVMEQHLGRYLETWEVVHHINHDKSDNRLENLKLLSHSEHSKLHSKKDTSNRFCSVCGGKTCLNPNTGSEMWYTDKSKKWLCRACYQREHRPIWRRLQRYEMGL